MGNEELGDDFDFDISQQPTLRLTKKQTLDILSVAAFSDDADLS